MKTVLRKNASKTKEKEKREKRNDNKYENENEPKKGKTSVYFYDILFQVSLGVQVHE